MCWYMYMLCMCVYIYIYTYIHVMYTERYLDRERERDRDTDMIGRRRCSGGEGGRRWEEAIQSASWGACMDASLMFEIWPILPPFLKMIINKNWKKKKRQTWLWQPRFCFLRSLGGRRSCSWLPTKISLLRFVDSKLPGNSPWAWEFNPLRLRLRFCLSQTLWSPES